jgi:hypothetical protein
MLKLLLSLLFLSVTGAHAQVSYEEPDVLLLGPSEIPLAENESRWIFRLYFGPTTTAYANTDITINTPSLSANIENVTIYQRTSYEYYKVWEAGSFRKALKFIDEPTNKIFLELEKEGKFAAGIMYFHPKFLITNNGMLNDETKVGINFINEDKLIPAKQLNKLFESYRLTKGLINFEGYVDYVVTLKKNENGSCFEWKPGVGGGTYLGYVTLDGSGPQKKMLDDHTKDKIQPIGWSCSVNNKLVFKGPKQKMSVQLGHSFSYGQLQYDFLDGQASHRLVHNNLSLSVGAALWTIPKRKEPE